MSHIVAVPVPSTSASQRIPDYHIQMDETATKTLPASWYCSQKLYHLEQRAVFYKAWYLVGAVPRFAVDQEVEYEFAGVAIVVSHKGNEKFKVTRKADVRTVHL